MREHKKSEDKNSGGNHWCEHCGAIFHPQMNATCVDRPGQMGAATRARPPSGVDDADAIHARLAELKADREAVEKAKAAPAAMAPHSLGIYAHHEHI